MHLHADAAIKPQPRHKPEEKTGDDADAAGDDTRGADFGPKAPLLASVAAVGFGLDVGSCIEAFGIPSILGGAIAASLA